MTARWPALRGTLTEGRPLDTLTWLRVGGPADALVQPADEADLAAFLRDLPPDVPVMPMGAGSNMIVRDGGIRGVVVRLGRGFREVGIDDGGTVTAGAAALDARVAQDAAAVGRDLIFLRTIPGTIGGAVRMNAGCYGTYVADVLVSVRAVTRAGEVVEIPAADLKLDYRSSALPPDTIVTHATFFVLTDDPNALAVRMDEQVARRDLTQPTKERSAGSTFRNPAGFSSTGRDDDIHDLKAWRLIEDAGLRGFRHGGAQMSAKHPNFLLNAGGASASELEELGEIVRKKVHETSGIRLEWEIMRVGESAAS